MNQAISKLQNLQSASPADLPEEDGPEPWNYVLRRSDLLDLFDTSPDLGGNEIDVSRFIRSREEKDCYLTWRTWNGDLNDATEARKEVSDGELCPVPIGDLREFVKKHDVYAWSFVDSKWKTTDKDRLFPGMILLTHAKGGGYTFESGWNPNSRTLVPPLLSDTGDPEGDSGDPLTFENYRQTLEAHTKRVVQESEKLLNCLSHLGLDDFRGDILTAAAKHDWGKAHPVMQRTLHAKDPGDELLAKQRNENAASHHERKHFRHELASALAMLAANDPPLSAYVVAAHHGKVRLSIRSMPGENNGNGPIRVRGLQEGDQLPDATLVEGVSVDAVKLSLEPMTMGLSRTDALAWTDRAIQLRDELGPFRLAYLEMVLRAADEKASADWEPSA